MKVALNITDGPKKGTSFTFDQHAVVLVGRSQSCGSYCIGNDPDCSKVHLLVEVAPPTCGIRDLGSTNHTFVNGKRTIHRQLNDGDVVKIGKTKLVVQIEYPIIDAMFEEEDVSVPASLSGDPDEISDLQINLASSSSEEPWSVEAAGRVAVCVRCGRTLAVELEPWFNQTEDSFVCAQCRAAMVDNGEAIPGCRLVRQLAQGGMGVLWLAQQAITGRQVVVKMISPDISSSWRVSQMFLRESHISMGLHHPHIVEFLQSGQFEGQLFVVMEYVEGLDSEAVRKKSAGRLAPDTVISIGLQCLDALDYAHGRGIIHRDLKPANILLSGDSSNYCARLTDFGMSRNYRDSSESGITTKGEARGSVPFMSPEQVLDSRNCDQRTDVFGLGATLYHLLTGSYVYDFVATQEPFVTIIESPVVPIENRGVRLPSELAEVINKSLQKNRDDRYASAILMRNALSNVKMV